MPRQRTYILTGTLVAATAGLALFFPWMGAVCLVLVVLAVLGLILAVLVITLFGLARLCRLSKRPVPWKPVWICLAALSMGLSGLLATNLWIPPALPPRPLQPSEELAYLMRTDQEDRGGVRLVGIMDRDRLRLARVLQLHEQGLIRTPLDCLAAAIILQHGTDSAHYQLAHELAKTARDGGVEDADWVAKATYDRWMLSTGQPQVYGTQSTLSVQFKKD